MTRVAEFMERMDTWKKDARRNFGIAPTPVGAIPKEPKLGDPHVHSLSSAGSSPFLQITLPVVKAGFVVEGWCFCEFTINTDAVVTSISKTIFDKVAMVATNRPTLDLHGSTKLTLARAHRPQDVAIFSIMVVENEEAVLGRNAIQYFWPDVLRNVKVVPSL